MQTVKRQVDMEKDSALVLKELFDRKQLNKAEDARELLGRSKLVEKLLVEPKKGPQTFVGLRAIEWRLLELSEIPFSESLPEVQEWLRLLTDRTHTKEGFSLTGERDGMLACHNAMITRILIRMRPHEKEKIDDGIRWILEYQSTERGADCKWSGKDLYTRWGGCMKKTPCYYGVVKSVAALSEYAERIARLKEVGAKLQAGLEYMLRHKLFRRLSTGEPIEKSIVENFYPYPYKTNLIEMLALLKRNKLSSDPRAQEAAELLRSAQRSDGYWQTDASFMKSAWVDFDGQKKPGLWITYIVKKILEDA
ncbi:hypothetical protein GX441_03145 [bacterium]|nr:hypothetical protein [bacterium]